MITSCMVVEPDFDYHMLICMQNSALIREASQNNFFEMFNWDGDGYICTHVFLAYKKYCRSRRKDYWQLMGEIS